MDAASGQRRSRETAGIPKADRSVIAAKVKIVDETHRVKKAVQTTTFKTLSHAAATLRKDTVASIQKAPQGEASEPGEPIHTHRGAFARRAMRFDVDKAADTAIIGFRHSVVGTSIEAHEKGIRYKGRKYPERPTIGPQLVKAAPRFAQSWRGSVG